MTAVNHPTGERKLGVLDAKARAVNLTGTAVGSYAPNAAAKPTVPLPNGKGGFRPVALPLAGAAGAAAEPKSGGCGSGGCSTGGGCGSQKDSAPPAGLRLHTTGTYYYEGFAVSTNDDKSSDRRDDGHVTSHQYINQKRRERGEAERKARADERIEPEVLKKKYGQKKYIDMDYHHPLEDWLDRPVIRRIFGWISKDRPGGTLIEQILKSYGDPKAPLWDRLRFWPFHRFIDVMKGKTEVETFRQRISGHSSTVRAFVIAARSVAEFGLTLPQRFTAPLFIVWNFTHLCNLTCKHCYQEADHKALPDELSLEEKLDLVDQMGRAYVPMIAFAGGEPTLSPHLEPVLERCKKWGIHTTIATHGGTMTKERAARYRDLGVKYIEISLDSVRPERHDEFRGMPGMWHRTVRGIRNVVETEGLRCGVAMCVHQGNFAEVDDMLDLLVDIGVSVFAHFNFIPVGRGLKMVDGDLNPQQREDLLRKLNQAMQSGKIGVISTAPQFGRVCVAHSNIDGKMAASHAGSGSGEKARVVAKYLGGCGAGRDYVAVEPNGWITPCVYLPHRPQGNIRDRTFMDIFRNNEYWELLCDRDRRLHHCEVCQFKHYCGGCRARADAYFGELNAGDPGCVFNEKHWEKLVDDGVATDPARPSAATAAKPSDDDSGRHAALLGQMAARMTGGR